MAGHRCSNCGAVALINEAYCRTCGHQNPAAAVRWRMAEPHRSGINRQAVLSAVGLGAAVRSSDEAFSTSTGAAASTAPATKSSRRRRPFVFVPVTLALVIAAVTAFYVVRVRQTFETINSVSTPANVVSGAALGGSSDITIDTGPAQTALAGGSSGDASTNETQPAVPGGSDGGHGEEQPPDGAAVVALPTASATIPTEAHQADTLPPPPAASPAPAIEPTATNTAEPEPILSEIDRIKNGGFEEGANAWYLEEGAAVTAGNAHSGNSALEIDATGGYAGQRFFFVPETTYHLSLWARLSAAGDETAQVGVGYADESGTRLNDLEPPVVNVAGAKWSEITIDFTPPAAAADVFVYLWKPSGTSMLLVDDVSVRSIVPEEALDAEIRASDADSMTVLLMGVDARPGEAIDTGVRPDSLMVLHLNSRTGSCRLLSIPRDTRTELPGYGLTKVNHALAVGGIPYQMQVVELLTGLELDHYVLIDFNGFEDLVDAVGGITVDVPEAFVSSDGRQFLAGEQEMSGKAALSYARFRGGADGDFGRMQRQQQILRAIVARASGLNILASINELLPAVGDNLRTDFSPTEMTSVAKDYQSRCTESTITMTRLEGVGVTYADPLLQMPLYYIEVDEAEIRSKVADLIEL